MQGIVGLLIITLGPTANLQRNLPVKTSCKSIKIWHNYGHEFCGPAFFGPRCMCIVSVQISCVRMSTMLRWFKKMRSRRTSSLRQIRPTHNDWTVAVVQSVSGWNGFKYNYRVKWHHRVYGHNTTTILWVQHDIMRWVKWQRFIVLFK